MSRSLLFRATLLAMLLSLCGLVAQPEPVTSNAFPQLEQRLGNSADCGTCNGETLTISGTVTFDFSSATPAVVGSAALAELTTFQTSGQDRTQWKATLDLGQRRLVLASNAVIKVNGGAGNDIPGLEILTACTLEVAQDAQIRIDNDNQSSGELRIVANRGITVNGTITQHNTGTYGTQGGLTLATGCGPLLVSRQGQITIKASQQGSQALRLLTFQQNAAIQIDGLVETNWQAGQVPDIDVIAFAAGITIDGNALLGIDANDRRRIVPGVHMRSSGVGSSGQIRIQADDTLEVQGYASDRLTDGNGISMSLDTEFAGNAAIPVTLNLTQVATGRVRVDLDVPSKAAYIRACFANFLKPNNLADLTIEGQVNTQNMFKINNGVDGISGYWMYPPGAWDMGFGIGADSENLTSATFEVVAEGLQWQDLVGTQEDGLAFGVVLQPALAAKSSNNPKMVVESPRFFAPRQPGTVSFRGKGQAGTLLLSSINNDVRLHDHAVDNANDLNNGTVSVSAWQQAQIAVTTAAQAALEGGRAVIRNSPTGASSGSGTTTVISERNRIEIAAHSKILTQAGQNLLKACLGVTNQGVVLPADSDTSDDSGQCAVGVAVTFNTPEPGSLLNTQDVSLSGTLTPANASLRLEGTDLTAATDGSWNTQVNFAEGTHTVLAAASHNGRNATATTNFTVDVTAPLLALQLPDEVQAGSNIAYTWAASDNLTTVSAALYINDTLVTQAANGSASFAVPLDYGGASVAFRLEASDAAGNLAQPLLDQVVVLAAPDVRVAIQSPNNDALLNQAEVAVSGTHSPADAQVLLNDQPVSQQAGTWSTTRTLAEGAHTLQATANSSYGNASDQVAIIVDLTPPEIVINAPLEVAPGTAFTWDTLASDANGIANLTVLVDGSEVYNGANDSFSGNLTMPSDVGATLEIRVLTTDQAAWQSEQTHTVVHPVVADLSLTVAQPVDQAAFASAQVPLSGTVVPAGASVTLDSGEILERNGSDFNTILVRTDGNHQITVNASASGQSASETRQFLVDTTPPVITLEPPAYFLRGESYSLDLSASDALSAVASIDLQRDATSLGAAAAEQRSYAITVPANETAEHYNFTAIAEDALGNRTSLALSVAIVDLNDLDRVVISVQSPDHAAVFDTAAQSIVGTITPAEASLTANGAAVAVDAAGNFTLAANLDAGLNTYLFLGTHPGYLDGTAKRDLYFDNRAPQITILDPINPYTSPTDRISIRGYIRDESPALLSLDRDAQSVTLQDGHFLENDVQLVEGLNTFTYTATDSVGNSATTQLTVNYNPSAIAVVIDAPDLIRPGSSFPVSVTFSPIADVHKAEVSANRQVIHRANHGEVFSTTLTHDGTSSHIPITAWANDEHGVTVKAVHQVKVARNRFVEGQVLQHHTGYPLVGQSLEVRTPLETQTLTTDERGQYNTYILGLPIEVSVAAEGYVPSMRMLNVDQDVWRVSDLRLTPRGESQSLAAATLTNDQLEVQTANFSGNGQLTAFDASALPALLPLGFAPVSGFTLSDTSAQGSLSIQFTNLSATIQSEPLFLLRAPIGAATWQVLDAREVTGDRATFTLSEQPAGHYLGMVVDRWYTDVPVVGTQVERRGFFPVPAGMVADSFTQPASVSVLEDPLTMVNLSLENDFRLPSGAQARIQASEAHQRFDSDISLDPYAFDLHVYSYGAGAVSEPQVLAGQLPLRAREMVDPDWTKSAIINLDAYRGHIEARRFQTQAEFNLGALQLSIDAQDFNQRVLAARLVESDTTSLAEQFQVISSFALEIGGSLSQSPQITLPNRGEQGLLLLQLTPSGDWSFVSAFTASTDQTWTLAQSQTALQTSDTFAVVAYQQPITLLSGRVQRDGAAAAGARLREHTHRIIAIADQSGNFNFFTFQSSQSGSLSALHPASRRIGNLALPATQGQAQLSNLNLALAPINFGLAWSQPYNGEIYVPVNTDISLVFSEGLSTDTSHIQSHVQLQSQSGTPVVVEISLSLDRTELILQPLIQLNHQTSYSIQLSADLETRFGDRLGQAQSLSFETARAEVTGIDLDAFYLEVRQPQMLLLAPADSYPQGTQLRIFDPLGELDQELTLNTPQLEQVLGIAPGLNVQLEALTPDGVRHQKTITAVVYDDFVRVGRAGFKTLATERTTLNLPQGLPRDQRLRIIPQDAVAASARLTEVPMLADFDLSLFGEAIDAFSMTFNTNTPSLEDVVGSLEVELGDISHIAEGQVIMVSTFTPVMLPASPETPEDLIAVPTMTVQVINIHDGQLAYPNEMVSASKVQLSFDLNEAPAIGTEPADPSGKRFLGEGMYNMIVQNSLHLGNTIAMAPTLTYLSVSVKPCCGIDRPGFDTAYSFPGMPSGHHVFAEAPLFHGGKPVGKTDDYGLGKATVLNSAGGAGYQPVVVMDRWTSETRTAIGPVTSTFRDTLGAPMARQSHGRVAFDADDYYARNPELAPGPPQPALQATWEVIDLVDGERLSNPSESQRVQQGRLYLSDDPRVVRLTVRSNKTIIESDISIEGLSSPEAERTGDARSVTFEFPTEFFEAERLLVLSVNTLDADGLSAQYNHSILLITPNEPVNVKMGQAPRVAFTQPDDAQQNVPVNQPILVQFSEPITGVDANTIRIEGPGGPFQPEFRNRLNEMIGADFVTSTVKVVLDRNLRYDGRYRIVVDGVRDSVEGEPDFVPFSAEFTTMQLQEEDISATGAIRDLIAAPQNAFHHVNNLLFHLRPESASSFDFVLSCYDTNSNRQNGGLLWHKPIDLLTPRSSGKNRIFAQKPNIAIFFPAEIQNGNASRPAPSVPITDLPVGSGMLLSWQSIRPNNRDIAQFTLLLYAGNGNWTPDTNYVLQRRPGAGPFVMAQHHNRAFTGFYANNTSGLAGGTVSYDAQRMFDPGSGVKALQQQFSDRPMNLLTQELQKFEDGRLLDPEAILDLKVAPLGNWASGQPGLLMVSRSDNAKIVSAATRLSPADAGLVTLNTRNGNTTWRGDIIPALNYLDPASQITRTQDIAAILTLVPSEQGATLRFYPLTRIGNVAAVRTVGIPIYANRMAVDRENGLIALTQATSITAGSSPYAIIDVRKALEFEGTSDFTFDQPGVLVNDSLQGAIDQIYFHEGTLYAGKADGRLSQTEIIESNRAITGWEVLSMDQALLEKQPPTLKYMPNLVLYAQDRGFDQSEANFVMEMASFAVEMQQPGEARMQIIAKAGNHTFAQRRQRHRSLKKEMLYFPSHDLSQYYAASANQASLREQGFHSYEVLYQIYDENRVLLQEDTYDLIVAYRSPNSRHKDPHRLKAGLDLLSGTPDIAVIDQETSYPDPRFNIAPQRIHHGDFAFHRGAFGGGMVSGQLLKLGVGVWWQPSAVADEDALPDFTTADVRLALLHPGQFQLESEVDFSVRRIDIKDDLLSQISRDSNGLYLDHRRSMRYRLAITPEHLPDPATYYEQFNLIQAGGNRDSKTRFPLLRFATEDPSLPPNFYGNLPVTQQVRMPWNNTLTFQDAQGEPSTRPTQIVEDTRDAGGQRTQAIRYQEDRVQHILSADGVLIRYTYDEDGYLTLVERQGNGPGDTRTLRYSWQSFAEGVGQVGDFQFKRLTAVTEGSGNAAWQTQYRYGGNGLRVNQITTPFGSKAVTVQLADGLPSSVTVGATANAPVQVTRFNGGDAAFFSSGYGQGATSFNLSWQRRSLGNRSDWLLTSDSYQNQSYGYSDLGLLLSHSRYGDTQSWTYGNSGAFMEQPTAYTDPLGQSFTIATSAAQQTTSAAGFSQTLHYSTAGVAVAQTDLDGWKMGPESSTHYVPTGSGYFSNNGRQTVVPIPARQALSAAEYTYNGFGDLTGSKDMGVATVYNALDSLGRPTQITYLEGQTANVTYSYVNGIYRVVTNDVGQTIQEDYNELGWLLSRQTTIDGEIRLQLLSYDDLGRLIRIQDGVTALATTYFGDSNVPTQVVTADETRTYTVTPAFVPTQVGNTLTQGTTSRNFFFTTDALGRVTQYEKDNVGIVDVSYDAFSRPIAETSGGFNVTSWTYGQTQTEVDYTSNKTTAITYRDASKLDFDVAINGPNTTPYERTFTTVITPDGNKGYIFDRQESGGPVDNISAFYNALGHYLGESYGNQSLAATTTNDRGVPTQFNGSWSANYTYDDLDRLTGGTDFDGASFSNTWDVRHRSTGGSNSRGQTVSIDYESSAHSIANGFTVGGFPFASEPTPHQADVLQLTGAQRSVQSTDMQTYQVTKPAVEGEAGGTATVNFNPASGLYQGGTSYAGQSESFGYDGQGRVAGNIRMQSGDYNVSWQDNTATIAHPSGESTRISLDAFGQLTELDMPGIENDVSMQRDSEQRLLTYTRGDQTLRASYAGEDLISFIGGQHDAVFSDYNSKGLPGRISYGSAGFSQMQWHDSGQIATITNQTRGGTIVHRYNQRGDLLQIRTDRYRLDFTPNDWGYAESVSIDGDTPITLLGDRNNLTFDGPATARLRFNQEGRLIESSGDGKPFVRYTYDADGGFLGRTATGDVREYIFQEVQDTFGLLSELIVSVTDLGSNKRMPTSETFSFSYNAQGLPTELQSDRRGQLGRSTYLDGSRRIESYTDPNGVTATYDYTLRGDVRTIDIEAGPTFRFDYDDAGFQTLVEVADMDVRFEDYVNGVPSSMVWGSGETFNISSAEYGLVDQIASDNGAYLLDVDWQRTASGQLQVARVEKRGPGFGEVWEPTYNDANRLVANRTTRDNGVVIEETYNVDAETMMPTQLTRVVDGQAVLDMLMVADQDAAGLRIGRFGANRAAGGPAVGERELEWQDGNLAGIVSVDGNRPQVAYRYDAFRHVTGMTAYDDAGQVRDRADWEYNLNGERYFGEDGPNREQFVYFYEEDRVIAIGYNQAGTIRWTHAIGYGPFGPALIKDLTGAGNDYYLFTDHLGTPFAYRHADQAGLVSYTPFNAWGELMATVPGVETYQEWTPVNAGFNLPDDGVFHLPPIGIGGHPYDPVSGLVYMRNRHYHPRLMHFLTYDEREMEMLDPTSMDRPWAYAAGNPVTFMDPDGRQESIGDKLYAWEGRLIDEGSAWGSFGVLILRFLWEVLGTEDFSKAMSKYAVKGFDSLTAGEIAWAAFDLITSLPIIKWVKVGGKKVIGLINKHFGKYMKGVSNSLWVSLWNMVEVVKNSYAKMEASVRGGVERAVTAVRKRQAVWAARAADTIAGKNRILRRAGYEKWEVRDMMQRHIICFLAGTLVLTANGAVPIEDIQPGMQVWSRHEVTGQAGFKPVVYRFETQSGELLDLVYETGDGEQHELTTTPEHPFYIAQEDAWFAAADLVVGDQVMTATSETADVIRVAAKRGPPEGTPTYNLAIADHHTYFVAAEGTPEAKQWSTALWVHNTGRGKCDEAGGTFSSKNRVLRAVTPEQARTIRAGQGIIKPIPAHRTTPTQHVAGTRHSRNPWTSATRSERSVRFFATHGGTRSANPIVEIDLSKIDPENILDVSTPNKAAQHLKTPFTRNAASYHEEVLIKGDIPIEAIRFLD